MVEQEFSYHALSPGLTGSCFGLVGGFVLRKLRGDIQKERLMLKDKREKRDLHALNSDGMVLCNPRDKEAAHRAEMEGIATDDRAAVTCRKCLSVLYKRDRVRVEAQGHS
jgi:hypothetical protein